MLPPYAFNSSLIGPDSETTSNNVVIVGHGISGELSRWEDMKISKMSYHALIMFSLLTITSRAAS